MAFNLLPYTNFHDLNLDWILERVKEMIAAKDEVVANMEAAQEAITTAQEAEASAEASAVTAEAAKVEAVAAKNNAAISANVAQAALDNIGTGTSGAVADWLTEHVDPDTGYIIDDTLSIAGAAADALATGIATGGLLGLWTENDRSSDLVWETGTISNSGQDAASTVTIRTVGIQYPATDIPPSIGITQGIYPLKYQVVMFDASGTYVSKSGWYTSDFRFLLPHGYGFRLLAQRQDSQTPATDMAEATFTDYSYTDTNLIDGPLNVATPGKAADAYTVADIILTKDSQIRAALAPLENYAVRAIGSRITNANNAVLHMPPSANADTDALPNRVYTITNANLVTGLPVNTPGTLFGFNTTAPNEAGFVQFFVPNTKVDLYFRLRWGAAPGTWGAWQRLLTGANLSGYMTIEDFEDAKTDYINGVSGSIGIYNRFGVIGDSFASGEVYTAGGTRIDNFYLSWGQQLARRLGNTCVNLSNSGLTTRTWLTNANGLAKLNSEDECQCYICNLGINDANQLGTSYLGTIADIHDGDPSANADTFYGNYGRIIEAIKSKNANAHIIMVGPMRNATVYQTFRTAVQNIANHYGIPFINVYDDDYFHSAGWTTQVSSHPTANDYAGIAMAMERLYSKNTVSNYTYYEHYTG